MNCSKRFRLVGWIHRRIDVRPERERLAPVGHREIRIQALRFPVRAACFRVIERVRQVQPLIHEELRLRILRRYRKLMVTQVLKPRRERAGWRL